MPALDAVLAQSEEIRRRFLALGAPPEKVRVAGNFKFDFEPRELAAGSPVKSLLDRVQPAQVWIAASTMPPARREMWTRTISSIAAFQPVGPRYPGLMLILAPRKPERFDVTAGKAGCRRPPVCPPLAPGNAERRSAPGPAARFHRRTEQLCSPWRTWSSWAGRWRSAAGTTSWNRRFTARPVLTGPHMENFQAIADDFRAHEASVSIGSAQELASFLQKLRPIRMRRGGSASGRALAPRRSAALPGGP